MFKIISVGKIKEPYLVEAIKEYQKRISKYIKIQIIIMMPKKQLKKKVLIL